MMSSGALRWLMVPAFPTALASRGFTKERPLRAVLVGEVTVGQLVQVYRRITPPLPTAHPSVAESMYTELSASVVGELTVLQLPA